MTVSLLDALAFKARRRNVPPPVYNENNVHEGLLDERRSKRGNQNQSGAIRIPPIIMGTSQGTNSSIKTQPTALLLVENSSLESHTIDDVSSQSFVDHSQMLDEMSTERSPSRPDLLPTTSSTNNIPDESLCQNPSSTSSGMFKVNDQLSTPKILSNKP